MQFPGDLCETDGRRIRDSGILKKLGKCPDNDKGWYGSEDYKAWRASLDPEAMKKHDLRVFYESTMFPGKFSLLTKEEFMARVPAEEWSTKLQFDQHAEVVSTMQQVNNGMKELADVMREIASGVDTMCELMGKSNELALKHEMDALKHEMDAKRRRGRKRARSTYNSDNESE